MKQITCFECEVCQRRYNYAINALECEARPEPKKVPVGMVYNNATGDCSYRNITFSVAHNDIVGHWNHVSSWACRDTGMGDSLFENMCGTTRSSGWGGLGPKDAPDPAHPTFRRMVGYLEDNHIEVTCWDGQGAVPLDRFLLSNRKGVTP